MENSLVSGVSEVEKREALQRVLSSSAFHRSDQLKTLLRYICEREIAGRGDALDEYAVAVEALGRPSDYSAFEDGAARNRIHNLRRRLEQYYGLENPHDPLQIVIPKGSYCPVFLKHPAAPPPAPQLAIVPTAGADAPPPRFWDRRISLGAVLILFALTAVLSAGLAIALRKTGIEPDPLIAAAWGPLLAKNANPLICVSTAVQLTLMQRPADPQTSPTVISPDLTAWYRSLPGMPPAKQMYLGPSLTAPFWGDVAAALAVTHVLDGAGIVPEALPESAIQLPALSRRNLLMFGRPGFSKTVDLYLRDKPFRVLVPDEEHTTLISNVEPKAGEPAEYNSHPPAGAGNAETEYGLITVMPSWGDSNLRTVVFSGTLSPGTQAAAEFFSSAKQLRFLLNLFRREGLAGFPPAYQVVVRSNVSGTSALDVHYVTHRVISKARN